MPVTSKNGSSMGGTKMGGMSCDGCCSSTGPHGMSKKIFWAIMCVVLIFVIICVDALTNYLNAKYMHVGRGERAVPTFTVTGRGKVTGHNDIAMTTIGFSNIDKDVALAQTNNTKVIDQITADLKRMGIESRDLQTSYYNIAAEYSYPEGKPAVLQGFRVTNRLTVKIRDLNKVGTILALAGKYGANDIGDLVFTIDDAETLRAKARESALSDARMKAEKLAASLGMRLVEVVNYSEYQGGGYDEYALKNEAPRGIGGAVTAVPAAPIASGSTDVEVNVNLTYEMAPR